MRPTRESGRWVQIFLVFAIGWFYFWTATPEWRPELLGGKGDGYYNLLTRGFMRGHFYLDLPADPFLATLKNPSDPVARQGHGLHDASYYRGHYYLYFGVAPVVLLFLPFRLLTGRFIDESLASPAFACAGFLFSVLLLREIRRRHFPQASPASVAGCIVALGLCAMVPDLLRRPSVWEVPITCGYLCSAAGLWALFQALHSGRPAAWLAGASLALGLAVGSRPVYLFGSPALLVPLAWAWRRRRREWIPLALAAFLPIAAVGLGLAFYNYERFGSPLDFGFRHLMNGEQVASERLFAWSFLWYNLRLYFLVPAGWSRYFPFVSMAALPPAPAGHLGAEDPYGILTNMPFALLVLGLAGLFLRRPPPGRGPLVFFCAAAVILAAGTGAAVTAFGGAINRYMVDFLPAGMLLASVGFLEIGRRLRTSGRAGRVGMTGAFLLLAYSAVFNLFASMRHNELFRADHPALYRRVAHRWDWLPYLYDRWRGVKYGPIEMTVVFPQGHVGDVEPLVVTGRSFLSDFLFVHYLGPDSLRFGLEHTSRGTFLGPAVRYAPGQPHVLRIDLGSLYPPAADPYFDRMPPGEARLRQHLLRVTLDGQVALDRELSFYDADGPAPSIGNSGSRQGFGQPFSGRILAWRRLGAAPVAPAEGRYGALRLRMVLPAFSGVRSEPLVSFGETGRGDLVSIRYLAKDWVAFGYDHWGWGGYVSPAVRIDPGGPQTIEIDAGGLHPGREAERAATAPERRGRLEVRLNGLTALGLPVPFYACDPDTVSVGLNAIGASTAQAVFSGSILATDRLAALPSAPEYGAVRLMVVLPSFTGIRNEPLVCSGAPGRGDLVYVRYEAPDRISLGYDHWSAGGPRSASCRVDPRAVQTIEVDFGALHPGAAAHGGGDSRGRLTLELNGRKVLDQEVAFYSSDPQAVSVGFNPIQASTAGPSFTGELIGTQRIGRSGE